MYVLNKSILVKNTNTTGETVYSVITETPHNIHASIREWKTNLFRGVLATVTPDGTTNINENAPIHILKEISDLINW
jgi:hypothetical protein